MAEAILLGPFAGGLNTASDQSAVADDDLTLMDNFELDLDRALVSRPPIEVVNTAFPPGDLRLLGIFYRANVPYLIASDFASSTYYFNGTAWILITSSLGAGAMAQYKDKAWLVARPGSGQRGGSWDPTNGYAVVSGMPEGGCIAVSKERLWIGGGKYATTNGSRLTYCAPSDPTRWPASTPAGGGFIEISGGDGQNIVEIINYYNDIAIFKEHSTYRFSYASSPDGGQVTPLDRTIGCADAGCVVQYRSSNYVLYGEAIYELTNASFVPLNMKVPFNDAFVGGLKQQYSLGAWDGRVFVQYNDKNYVFNIDTQTWSTWSTELTTTIGRVFRVSTMYDDEPYAYVDSAEAGGVTGTPSRTLYKISRDPSLVSEPIVCRIRTKIYDYQVGYAWKRLMFWGSDVNAPQTVDANVIPVATPPGVPWNQLSMPWNSPLTFTWATGTNMSINVTDSAIIASPAGARRFIKFLKSLRFRQIYFELTLNTNGTLTTGPCKIFTITTWVAVKQLVSKKIN